MLCDLTKSRYAPIQKFAPQDCVASINGIVEKMNEVFDSGHRQAITQMKTVFGLEDLNDADFAQAVAFPSSFIPFLYLIFAEEVADDAVQSEDPSPTRRTPGRS